MKLRSFSLPHFLLLIYVVEFCVLAIEPYDRATWWAENIPVVIIVGILVAMYQRFKFSNASYLMMSVFIFLHTIGGHYTFERVPFAWFSELFGFERNHYDRIAHFSVGFYAYPICEFIERKKLSTHRMLTALFGICAIFTVAAVYEIIEWIYAVGSDPTAGAAFLGSQGDIWDAQKDMLADGSGALLAVVLFVLTQKKTLSLSP